MSEANVRKIFEQMPDRYIKGQVSSDRSFYFSIGSFKATVWLTPDSCRWEEGQQGKADTILKTTPELFEKMVVKGKLPGPIDIARGKVKTNNPAALMDLKKAFDFKGV